MLAANYVANRLEPPLPGALPGRVRTRRPRVHPRPATPRPKRAGDVDDVAKRLIDYGFHAPTMCFPVAGTLMIEPTESESCRLDRFCDAMIAIRAEIDRVADGLSPPGTTRCTTPRTPLKWLSTDAWSHPFSRREAALPRQTHGARQTLYGSPVRRIDGAKGDRNLVCSCPPIDTFSQ